MKHLFKVRYGFKIDGEISPQRVEHFLAEDIPKIHKYLEERYEGGKIEIFDYEHIFYQEVPNL